MGQMLKFGQDDANAQYVMAVAEGLVGGDDEGRAEWDAYVTTWNTQADEINLGCEPMGNVRTVTDAVLAMGEDWTRARIALAEQQGVCAGCVTSMYAALTLAIQSVKLMAPRYAVHQAEAITREAASNPTQ